MSGFPQLGHIAIKKTFETRKLKHTKHLIEQAVHLKNNLESLDLKAGNCTIFSIDANKYYPSLRWKLVNKAIDYFAEELPQEDKAKIGALLEAGGARTALNIP